MRISSLQMACFRNSSINSSHFRTSYRDNDYNYFIPVQKIEVHMVKQLNNDELREVIGGATVTEYMLDLANSGAPEGLLFGQISGLGNSDLKSINGLIALVDNAF